MSIEIFQNLCLALSERERIYNPSSDRFVVTCSDEADQNSLKANLIAIGVESEEFFGNKLEFPLNDLPFKLFSDTQTFRLKMLFDNNTNFEEGFINDFAILQAESSLFSSKYVFYKNKTKETFVDFTLVENSYFFTNAENYVKFLHFLKDKEHKEDSFFHFVDYFSWDSHVIVFVSATKEGKLSIPFPNEIPEFEMDVDLTQRFERLYQAFDINDKKQKLPKFIKAELFNFLSKEARENRLTLLIKHLNEILVVAEQNFDIYLYDLSVENLKKDYLDSKDKYFGQLREILGKITAQIIALPLSVSAVAFATYNIPAGQDKTTIIIILIIAFIVYSFFAVFLLKLYKEDVSDIEHQYEWDFGKLENSEFFRKYKSEKIYFDAVKTRITRKIITMKGTILAYFLLLTLTNTILLWKLLRDISFYPLLSIVFALAQSLIYWYFYSEQRKANIE